MSKGQVGIFWRVAAAGTYQLISDSVPVDQAEPYGDFRTHGGHYEFWRYLAAMAVKRRRDMGIPDVVQWSEYEEWPRGRIVFHVPTNRFVLYADRKLQRPEIIQTIRQRFSLCTDDTDVRSDPHYVSIR